MNDGPHFNNAADANKDVILEQLRNSLQPDARVLEIGSGSGQHAIHFTEHLPNLVWQTSDMDVSARDLDTAIRSAQRESLPGPILLNVAHWPDLATGFDAVYSANCIHAMPGDLLPDYVAGAAKCLRPDGQMVLYGPFKYGGKYTTESNERFDGFLKQTFAGGGIRDFENVDALAESNGLKFERDVAMPSNNQFLVWRKVV